jgi:hypothetical protein
MENCSVPLCYNKHREKGYCSIHYGHIRHYGRILEATKFDPRPAIMQGPVAYIPLGINGCDGFAVVDAADSWVDKFKWHKDVNGYAVSIHRPGPNLRMHVLIMRPGTGQKVDHENGNKLFNRRENLRLCTIAQNMQNQRRRIDNSSGFKGVSFVPAYRKYRAYIGHNGKRYHLGHFVTAVEAASAYNARAIELHGRFARLNNLNLIRS